MPKKNTTPKSPGPLISLRGPTGTVYLMASEIIAIAACTEVGQNETIVKCRVWLRGQNDAFNILETAEDVFSALAP